MRLCLYIYINGSGTAQPEHTASYEQGEDTIGLGMQQEVKYLRKISWAKAFILSAVECLKARGRAEREATWPWERLDRGRQLAMRHEEEPKMEKLTK